MSLHQGFRTIQDPCSYDSEQEAALMISNSRVNSSDLENRSMIFRLSLVMIDYRYAKLLKIFSSPKEI